MKELVAQGQRFRLQAIGQVYRDLRAERTNAHLLGKESAFQRLIAERAAHCQNLGAKDIEGRRIELLVAVLEGAENRQTFDGAVVEDFHDVRRLVGVAQISFIED